MLPKQRRRKMPASETLEPQTTDNARFSGGILLSLFSATNSCKFSGCRLHYGKRKGERGGDETERSGDIDHDAAQVL